MLLFMIKKAFFDMWDNFLAVVLLNLGFIAVLTVPLLVPNALVKVSGPLSLATLVIGVILVFIYAGAASLVARDISDYKAPEFKEFLQHIKDTWKTSLVLAAIYIVHVFVLTVAFPVYSNMGNILGLAALVFLFWASVIWLLASQFYFPIRARLDTKITKILRKCFIVFFDNTGYAIASGLGVLIVAVLSGFTAFLIPGIGGLLLWLHVGFKLRLMKYDYLEENPDANRKRIPWDALLIDERERVGKRTLRGMIFPWKE